MNREVKPGNKYLHFKGDIIEVITVAKHTETLEDFVIYTHKGQVWARPYDMFNSEVDHEKYPDIKQKYRFEEIK